MQKVKVPAPAIQPEKCRKCIWGRWQETKQFCFLVSCIKGDGRTQTIITSATKYANEREVL